jgi:hypothetical protein
MSLMPLLGGHRLRRFDGISIKERGLTIANMRERILHQLVNRLNVARAEGCNVGGVCSKHFIFGAFIHGRIPKQE